MILVNLELNPMLAVNYKKLPQKARVMTEAWVKENLYCPSCPSDYLDAERAGKKVIDFTCHSCDEQFQLKSQRKPFRYVVMNSAYAPKIKAIRSGTNPNYLFLRYDPETYNVRDLFLVPRHFMTPSVIEKRKPLSEGARRPGWVGSNIPIGKLPLDARIPIVTDGHELPKFKVRNDWNQFLFLRDQTVYSRGWLADVLVAVRKLDKESFKLSEVYSFENELAKLHPQNKHIKPKIRQQLQILRDQGIVEFLGKGEYKIKK